METSRLEAFSDGVMAIIITITVLGIRVPEEPTLAGLLAVAPAFAIYAWSFQTVGTYWNNHHHLLRTAKQISPAIMWANLHLLFWLSLIPFATEWLGRHVAAPWPTAAYAALLLAAAVAYNILQQAIIADQGEGSELARAIGQDWKDKISLLLYAAAVGAAFLSPWASYGLVVLVLAIWFLPDPRVRPPPAR
ncbi:MAG: hypothetical protein JWP73_374 [Phenylobacterium sp.]|nr:hypothetical protein [Phenylobacterium sp.]